MLAMHTLFCALGLDEYSKVSSCSNGNEIWDKLEVTYERTSQVKKSNVGIIILNYRTFKIKPEEDTKSIELGRQRFDEPMELWQRIRYAWMQTPMEELIHDVPNSHQEDHYIDVDHDELKGNVQQDFGTGASNKILKMKKSVSDPTDIEVDVKVVVAVKVVITTNLEIQSFLSESVDELIHFLAIVGEMPTKEIDEFVSFSFNDGGKARATKSSLGIGVRKVKVIIPQKTIWICLRFGIK
ncbi:hypothetical protein J1N35_037244 [Gossypium stocksii]|uniref:Uncharacterized protein n=1 Tax=Gossypium stocksii TaxID=47602 RepID=A0A9D3ZLP1_9ROSI|nr:hypothetical protein J1N35_037244 [Gossypium stocksii]